MSLISTREAAKNAGFTAAHIRGLIAVGAIKGKKFCNSWAVDSASLDRYLRTNRKPGPKPLAKHLR